MNNTEILKLYNYLAPFSEKIKATKLILASMIMLIACVSFSSADESTEKHELVTSDFNLIKDGFGAHNYGVAWADYNRRNYENSDFVDNHINFINKIKGTSTIITQNLTYVIDENVFRQNLAEIQYSNGAWGYQTFTAEDLNYLSHALENNQNSLIYYTSLMGDNGIRPDYTILGLLDVLNADNFFAAYKEVMLQHATIAEKVGADLFIIGQELAIQFNRENNLSWGYEEKWNDILSSMRKIYSGKITYGAHFGIVHPDPNRNSNEALKLSFGNGLDAIGIDMYGVEPINQYGELTFETLTIDELIGLWAQFPNSDVSPVKELRKIYDLWNLPIVVTETARMSGRYKDGWEYDEKYLDLQGQANKYYADLFVLNVYLGDINISYPALPYQHEYLLSARDDFSANVNNKPSEDVIKYFFSGDFYKDNLEIRILPQFEFATGYHGHDNFFVDGFSDIKVYGGQGNDRIFFSSSKNNYKITSDADINGGTVTDSSGNILTFHDVEMLVFTDDNIIF